jgi:signal transduction histidine kinase
MKQRAYFLKRVAFGVAFLFSVVQATPAQIQLPSEPVVLTNAMQVRALNQAEAARHLPVRLHGVVLGEAEPGGDGFAMQDDTSGIYLRSTPDRVARLHQGDLIEVMGNSDPGWYEPGVLVHDLHLLGRTNVPEPLPVTFEQLLDGRLDAQWVEISGIVRFCEPSPNDRRKLRLELVTGGERIVVRPNVPRTEEPLVDAEVQLRGVCYYLFNKNRQLVSPMLAIPHDIPIIVKKPAPRDPFSAPLQSPDRLMQFAPEGSYGHRVHVRGAVTRYQPGEFVFIRDGEVGLRIQTSQKADLNLGDEIDVLGFPKHGEYSPMLEDAVFQIGAAGTPPQPVRLKQAADVFDHDSDLVELEGAFDEQRMLPWGYSYGFRTKDGTTFQALLRQTNGQPASPVLLPGSRVGIAGICSVERAYTGMVSGLSRPASFQLLLRSPADLVLIELPSWWTPRHITWLLGAVTGVLLLAVAGVMLVARMRLKEQAVRRAMAEAEFSAILKERNRLAGEVHDTLAQGLGAISMQLELVKDRMKAGPETVIKHIELAHSLVRNSLTEVRNAIWNRRSQVLENGDLAAALQHILKETTDDTGVNGHLQLTGRARRLPPVTENALLRVGQEAITNAMKHARPGRIEVQLEFEEQRVSLRVKDDGKGFDAEKPPANKTSFGLAGIRQRAAALGGELSLHSNHGQGTELKLTVPVS